jgi:hypothetical protein
MSCLSLAKAVKRDSTALLAARRRIQPLPLPADSLDLTTVHQPLTESSRNAAGLLFPLEGS